MSTQAKRTIAAEEIAAGDLPDDLTAVRWPDGWTETRDDLEDPGYRSTLRAQTVDGEHEAAEIITSDDVESDLQRDLQQHDREWPDGSDRVADGSVDAWRRQPVGPSEVAAMMGVRHETVYQWRFRELLPEPAWGVRSRVPLWAREQIIAWAEETGREVVRPGV